MHDPNCGRKRTGSLQHDDALSHSALNVREFFAKNDMITVDHPPYLSIAIFLLPKVKTIMRSEHFRDVGSIKHKTMSLLKGLISCNSFQ